MRKVLPLTLVLSLAAFGCTMNRTPGNGQPVSVTPSRSPAATPGSSSGNVPMASSYTVPTSNTRLSADDAAAMMRDHQAYNGRVLGYLSPAQATPAVAASGSEVADVAELFDAAAVAGVPVPAAANVAAAPTPGVLAATGQATLMPTPAMAASATPSPVVSTTTVAAATTPALTSNSFVVPSTTAKSAPISVSNASGKIVVTNVKNK